MAASGTSAWTLEAAEAELNRFIERRADAAKNGADRAEEMAWKASVRRYNERRRRDRLWEHLRHSEAMIRAHRLNAEIVVRRHEQIIRRCEEQLGITEETTKGAS